MKKTDDTPAGALPFEAAKPEETLPLLQSGVPRQARLQCWSPGRKHSYTSRIVKVHETAGLVSISVSKESPGGEEFEAQLVRESLEEILFSLHLPTDVIFFKGELRKGDKGFFNARIKEPIYKVQRREAMRLPISAGTAIRLDFGGGDVVAAQVVNVSEGGVAVSFSEKAAFEKVNAWREPVGLSFVVHGVEIVAKGSVRHGGEVGSTLVKKSYRLGFSFVEIDPKLRTELSQVVLEESAKYLGRF